MNTNLHKRLKKEKHKYAYMLTPMSSLHYSEEYGRAATAFMRGAEHGYKEAVKVAKELLEKKLSYIPMKGFLADFEAEMNKLLEEKK